MAYMYLALAIIGELMGSTLLKYSNGFKNIIPSISSILLYGICFFFLAKSLENITLSVAYAIWSGIGIVATTLISVFIFKENITLAGVFGIVLIISGVTLLNLYGNAH